MLILYVLEPLVLHRPIKKQTQRDPNKIFYNDSANTLGITRLESHSYNRFDNR